MLALAVIAAACGSDGNPDAVVTAADADSSQGDAASDEAAATAVELDDATEVEDGGAESVVIEYPTKEAALAAYESDERQAVVGIRLGATTNGRAVIVDGMG
jgi:uncharacterized protein (DUF1330 family)